MLSIGEIAFRWINTVKTNGIIQWVVIYPGDSAIHPSSNWGLVLSRGRGSEGDDPRYGDGFSRNLVLRVLLLPTFERAKEQEMPRERGWLSSWFNTKMKKPRSIANVFVVHFKVTVEISTRIWYFSGAISLSFGKCWHYTHATRERLSFHNHRTLEIISIITLTIKC